MITVRVDNSDMNRALQKFADQVGKDAPKMIADEARLFFLEGIKVTPPSTRKQGADAVERSVKNAHPVYGSYGKGGIGEGIKQGQRKYLDRAIESKDIDAINKALKRLGRKSRIVRYNKKNWQVIRRDGRVVGRRAKQSILFPEDIQARDADMKIAQKKAGSMKAAFVPVIRSLDRVTGLRSRIASWYSRPELIARSKRWLGSNYSYNLKGGSKSFVKLETGANPWAVEKFQRIFDRRTRAINKKARAVLLGAAGYIDGRYTIFKKVERRGSEYEIV